MTFHWHRAVTMVSAIMLLNLWAHVDHWPWWAPTVGAFIIGSVWPSIFQRKEYR